MSSLKKLPTYLRPREKAMKYGVNKLNDAELLAILLQTGHKKKNVIELAQELISSSGGLSLLIDSPINELLKYNGLKEAKSLKIAIIHELFIRYEIEKLERINKFGSKLEIATYLLGKMKYLEIEEVRIIGLNNKNHLMFEKVLFKGGKESVSFSPNIILEETLKMGSKRIYLAHSHPSNKLEPSFADLTQTNNLELFLISLGIQLIDHLIVGKYNVYSIKEGRILI